VELQVTPAALNHTRSTTPTDPLSATAPSTAAAASPATAAKPRGRPPKAGGSGATAKGKVVESISFPLLEKLQRQAKAWEAEQLAAAAAGGGDGGADGPAAAAVSPLSWRRLPKVVFLRELVARACVEGGERLVVFSERLDVLNLLQEMLRVSCGEGVFSGFDLGSLWQPANTD